MFCDYLYGCTFTCQCGRNLKKILYNLSCFDHCLPQGVFRCPQTPNINPYSTYKMALLCVLYILQDAQFLSAEANSGFDVCIHVHM